eukprot:scaffold3475_cov246-Prasinococcus_capsulatus_cf.AAC.2
MSDVGTALGKTEEELEHDLYLLRQHRRAIDGRLRELSGRGRGRASLRGAAVGRRHDNPGRFEKRGRDDLQTQERPSQKRRLLSSVVSLADGDAVGPTEDEGMQEAAPPPPKPAKPVTDNPNVAKRNRRMFGALLGTLATFRKEEKKHSDSDAQNRRQELLSRVEHKTVDLSAELKSKAREAKAAKVEEERMNRNRVDTEHEEKRLELAGDEAVADMCDCVRSQTEPSVMWMPVKHTQTTKDMLLNRRVELEAKKETRKGEWEEAKQALHARLQGLDGRGRVETKKGTERRRIDKESEQADDMEADVEDKEGAETDDKDRVPAEATEERDMPDGEPEDQGQEMPGSAGEKPTTAPEN